MAYDVDTLLAAFQASVIYIVVQEEETPSLACHMQHGGIVHSILNNCAVSLSQTRTSQRATNRPWIIRIWEDNYTISVIMSQSLKSLTMFDKCARNGC